RIAPGYSKNKEQGLKGRNIITPFQGWNIDCSFYQGRRASRLPLAIIFRAVGALIRVFALCAKPFVMEIAECLKGLIQALSRNEHDEIIKRLAVGGDPYRFYLIFGGNFLWRMLNDIPVDHLQLDHLVVEAGVARAVLRAQDKWSTVWLKQTDEVWQVAAAYPFRPEELDDKGELPEELRDLLCGRISFPIDCQDAGLTRFLNDVHGEWKRMTVSTSSIFDMTDHLWTRRT